MAAQNVGSSYPPPPQIYKRYTDENLAKLKQVNEQGVEAVTRAGVSLPSDFNIFDLEPPQPLTEGNYSLFGDSNWMVVDRNPTLEENNVPQLFPSGEIVFNFVELLDTLVREPDQAPEKIEQIKHIILNMKYLLNEYRPHQARETLNLIMKEQIEQRKRATNEVNMRCSELRQMLQNVKGMWKNMDDVNMDLDTEQEQRSSHSHLNDGGSFSSYYVDSDATQKMLKMIDEIE
ncbi:14527_t:CDS:2 [Acaulospora morrowiae]|uniref:Mediator of RNA polymerase II transcription subunit 7 n=1 Tax=Acaulospora morrowiae TaxID=94023 RepID=A0A9N8ZIG1_9GLOM|nr:14527_t:CDS:2 [Acaulospora morrowiae]